MIRANLTNPCQALLVVKRQSWEGSEGLLKVWEGAVGRPGERTQREGNTERNAGPSVERVTDVQPPTAPQEWGWVRGVGTQFQEQGDLGQPAI